MQASPQPPDRGPDTVAELLRQRAGERPDQLAFTFLAGNGEDGVGDVAWTYADLQRQVQIVAGAISRRAAPGDRAVLVFPPGLDFLAAFFGCMYAGVLPVPATYPKPRRPSPRLDAIVADCEPKLALTTAGTMRTMRLEDQSPAVRELHWLAVDECDPAHAVATPVARLADDLAFLQYTSGSTSEPRGVAVTHRNLLHNLELIRGGFDLRNSASAEAPQVGAFWLPAYHDMGLIGGILSPMYVGGTSYLLPPAAFLQRPISWLETLSRTGAACSGAPNFAYELCVRKTTPAERAALDLSQWQLAFCGAEPIRAETLVEFAEAFAPAGFREEAFFPCYGLAEATLMVTGGRAPLRVLNADRGKLASHKLADVGAGAPGAVPLVSCGRPLGDQQVVVVDTRTTHPCSEGEVGEIWVRSDSVAAGYWNHPDQSKLAFDGRLDDGTGPFLRTGDLGSLVGGELFVTGRLKDVIIIRGRNLYPQDIERTAQLSHEAVDIGAAFSVSRNDHEELVVVHQVEREHRRDDMAPVLRAIRSAIVEEHEVDPHSIVLLRPASLPLTSSGKVQRNRCRELFEAGELDAIAAWTRPADANGVPPGELAAATGASASAAGPPRPKFLDHPKTYAPQALAAEIQTWMLAWLSERVGVSAAELSPTAPFSELGMDSMTAVELNVDFEHVLGLRLPPVAAWSYPTPAQLSQYLAESLLGIAPAEEAAERLNG